MLISDNIVNTIQCEVNIFLENEKLQLVINDGPKAASCGGESEVYVKYTAKGGFSGLKKL